MGTDKEEVAETSTPTPIAARKPKQSVKAKVQSSISKQVTVVIVNFKTKQLLRRAYRSFRKFYPTVRVIFVDNGSMDQSREFVKEAGARPHNSFILLDKNAGHGPAMHKAIQQVDTPYVLTLDTDTETLRGGFLELMVKRMKADDNLYALGWRRWVDRISGVPKEWHLKHPPAKKFVSYVHPSAALYRVSMYHTLQPFFYHGAPCLGNMVRAEKRGLKTLPFPIRDYVKHLKAGTRRMYGGRWDPTSKTPKGQWREKDQYPI